MGNESRMRIQNSYRMHTREKKNKHKQDTINRNKQEWDFKCFSYAIAVTSR